MTCQHVNRDYFAGAIACRDCGKALWPRPDYVEPDDQYLSDPL